MKYLIFIVSGMFLVGCDGRKYAPMPEFEVQILTAAQYSTSGEACFHVTIHNKEHKDLEGNYCIRTDGEKK